MSDYDPIEIRMEQMEGYYRRFMNQSPRDAYDSEYGYDSPPPDDIKVPPILNHGQQIPI